MTRHLPVLGPSGTAARSHAAPPTRDDPLQLLRGGRSARTFAWILALLGLAWIGADKVHARRLDDTTLILHTALAPPRPDVEALPNRAEVPPKPELEDIVVDRFGRKRTGSGAIVLEDERAAPSAAGIDTATRDTLDAGGFFDPGAFDDARTVKRKAVVHLMPGIPNSVFFGAAVLVLLISFALFERYGSANDPRSRARTYVRLELTRWPRLARAMKSRWFQPAFQLPVVLVFVFVIVAGLIGSQEPGRNIAPVLTWNVWWIGLIFAVFLFGNLWCFVCPWTAIPDWIMRLSFTRPTSIRTLALRYPRLKLWMWPATLLFAFVTWLEIVYDAANRPWLTSLLGVGMVLFAWISLVTFERKAMCRYVCFVGRVSGQYALLGMLELRHRDDTTCQSCTTKDCYHGREDHGLPCPTHEFMGAMTQNQYCTLCTECVKSCPHDNIALNLRPPGADVLHPHRSTTDEAYLALLIFIVSAFHGMAMVPLWNQWEDALRSALLSAEQSCFGRDLLGFAGSHGGMLTFTLMMAACIVAPVLVYGLLCAAMRLASRRPDVSIRRLFVKFSYSLLPIALFYHLAHNATHVFYEWSKLRRLVSDPLGWGHDFFGTARAPLSALWSPESIWYLQVALVILGHIFGIVAAQREAFRCYDGDRRAAFRVHLVMMLGMALMSLLSLWLLAQPMYMRTAE